MGIRPWTATAIEEGGLIKWFTGLVVKGLVEAGTAIILGWVVTQFFLWKFPVDSLRVYFGSATEPAIWLATAIGLFVQFTLCTFTSPFNESE